MHTRDIRVAGSFTMEAAFIMSLTVIILLGFIFAGLYLRETCIFHSLVEMRVLRAERTLSEAIDREGHLEPERIAQIPFLQIKPKMDLDDALILAGEISEEMGKGWSLISPNPISVVVYNDKIGIEYQNKFKKGIPRIYRKLLDFPENFSETELVPKMEPEDFLRICRSFL